MYLLLLISITLAVLLLANLAAASLTTLVWRAVRRHLSGLSVSALAHVIFTLRVFPVALSAVLVVGFVIPAYLIDEPFNSGEVVSSKLAVLASISSLGLLIAAFRLLQSWLATRGLAADWLRNGSTLGIGPTRVPVYRIEHQFPVIAVIGIFRPRLFVADIVLRSLDKNEMAATLAHELGHLSARDNLKRTLLRICRDLVLLPVGTGLDLAWAQNAEAVADEFAASSGPQIALDLASALVKIARIVPEGSTPSLPAGAYLIDGFNIDITSRVRRLISLSAGDRTHRSIVFPAPTWIVLASFVLLLLLPLANAAFLTHTHEAIEVFVRLLV